jgi:ABC-type dipeptide/oligopeptide/nickel transport system permease component
VPRVTRLVRAVVITTKEHEFVDAARTIGLADRRILLRHLLPHTTAPVQPSNAMRAPVANGCRPFSEMILTAFPNSSLNLVISSIFFGSVSSFHVNTAIECPIS